MTTGPHLSRLADRAAAGHVPFQALFELTGRCHMDCAHCYLDIKHPPRNELSTDEVIGVLDQLQAAGTLFLTLTGGEIFLRKDVFDIMAAARARRFALRLFTSGTLLDRARVAEIARLRPLAVEISIYGGNSHAHDGITRRTGSLRKSLRAAVLLRQAGVTVAIKSPILTGTGEGHFDLIDLARRLGAGYKIDPSLVARRDGGLEPMAMAPDVDTLARIYRDSRVAPPLDALPPPRPPDSAPCAIARRVVRIGPTGDVFACSVFPIPAGNLRQQSFADIWNGSPVLQTIRGITLGDLHGECGGCARQGYCARCSAQALLEHGDFRGPSAQACDRAEARERAAGLPAPAGARRMADPARLGRRAMGSDFVPLRSLVRQP